MSQIPENVIKENIKLNIFLLITSLLVLGSCIATAIDFRNMAKENATATTTYFSDSFANSISVINWIIMGACIIIFFYTFYGLLNGSKP
jgi:predicted exporter